MQKNYPTKYITLISHVDCIKHTSCFVHDDTCTLFRLDAKTRKTSTISGSKGLTATAGNSPFPHSFLISAWEASAGSGLTLSAGLRPALLVLPREE